MGFYGERKEFFSSMVGLSQTKIRKNRKLMPRRQESLSLGLLQAIENSLCTKASDHACQAWGEAVACLASSKLHRHCLLESLGLGLLQYDAHTCPRIELTDQPPPQVHKPKQGRAFTGTSSPQFWNLSRVFRKEYRLVLTQDTPGEPESC